MADQDVAVSTHGQVDIRVPHEALCHLRMRAGCGQETPARVPQSVKVNYAPGVVSVVDAGGGQVPLEAPDCPVTVRQGEGRRVGHLAGQKGPQFGRRVGPQGQHVAPPVLGVGRFNRHCGLGAFKVETRPRQTRQFAAPQAAFHGQAVKRGALGAGHACPVGAAAGLGQQAADFIHGKRPPVAPAVGSGVQAVQVGNGRLAGPAVLDHPAAEALEGRQVVVETRRADAGLDVPLFIGLVGPQVIQHRQHLAGRDLAPEGKAAAVDHAPDAGAGLLYMLGRVALGRQVRAVVGHVFGQRLHARRLPAVKEALPRQQGLKAAGQPLKPLHQGRVGYLPGPLEVDEAHELPAEGFRCLGVGEARHSPQDAGGVAKFHVPLGRAASLARPVTVGRLKDSHGFIPFFGFGPRFAGGDTRTGPRATRSSPSTSATASRFA
ncbi:MAG: hypothetical protein NTY65_06155 [Planctomycetota bacterium]|nr:hypothetical protein [Planctomycetota bacterium]